ncbi:MAG: [FeFe] hydrogenase H-cluster radical SAM maturase HydG [bacterium]|nr:[FeFe] hydrogenase H-cluster radical SAM maturase HydG [bacterium]
MGLHIPQDIDIDLWRERQIVPKERDRYLKNGRDFIENESFHKKLQNNRPIDKQEIRDILSKSLAIQTLTLDETAVLLNVDDPQLWQEMRVAGAKVKKKVYDNRIVTFAPFYTGNLCVNDCLYCGFRAGNSGALRRLLTLDEVRREVEVLAGKIGHKRLIAVYGEHPLSNARYIVDTLRTIYAVKIKTPHGYANIRRVNVNAAPQRIEDLKLLHSAGIGTYQVFQETYHHATYAKVHPPKTIKADYRWRLYAMHRAFEAGIDDVGIGVLFGLYDWRFEVLGLVAHARELEEYFGIGPHTVSFPRLEPALNAPYVEDTGYRVLDAELIKLITVLRLAIPYTGMIVTARESAAMRRTVIPLGCTQTDASSRIGIGAYADDQESQKSKRQQFLLGDTRSLDEVVREFAQQGLITSFCTAGYRCGRTGKRIMDLLKSGEEGQFCKLNAILTFREWLNDFASAETREAGEQVIKQEMNEVALQYPHAHTSLMNYYERINAGERDLYF